MNVTFSIDELQRLTSPLGLESGELQLPTSTVFASSPGASYVGATFNWNWICHLPYDLEGGLLGGLFTLA